MKPLVLRAPFHTVSGYKTLFDTICCELPSYGYSVYPVSTDGPIVNDVVLQHVKPLTKHIMGGKELCIMPVQIDITEHNSFFKIPKKNDRYMFTMWETTQLSGNVVDGLNRCKGVIVPNKWNLENFKMDGVTSPIHMCPLFVDTDIFKYKRFSNNKIFTFGTGNGDYRKRINETIRCFLKAFPANNRNVQLKIKIDSNLLSTITNFSDDRIEINSSKMTIEELADWYHSLDVFVSGSSAEGWGFMQHEAMACGRPVMACLYAGLKEFFDDTVGYTVKFEEVPATGTWGYSNGFWSKFDESHMIKRFRECYNNKTEVFRKGKLSSVTARKFTIDNTIKKLINIMEE